jgi:hypothetical protein
VETNTSLNQINNTVERHSSRLEQVVDRISGLENKTDIKEKTEFLDKRLKTCERNGIKEQEVQGKGISKTFSKIIAENFPNLKKEMSFRYRKPPGQQIDMTKIEPLHSTLYVKQLSQIIRKEY